MWITISTGSAEGTGVEVTRAILVGRDPSADLVLQDDKVSRRHAIIEPVAGGGAVLRDLGSANGTWVDGRRISGEVVLHGGEEIRFGATIASCTITAGTGSADQWVGRSIGRYRITELIAEGSMGIVYGAEHERTGRRAALKVLNPRLFGSTRSRERFLAESRAAGAIEHPNIVPIYDADESAGVPYIAMKRVRGEDLHSVIARSGPLPPERAVSILAQVADALDAAHAANLVHRDVKPGNILITTADDPDGADRAYLSDFGIAKDLSADRGMTVPGHVVGTRDYMAPEQFTGEAIDGRTDQYALGCVLFEALTGARPYVADSETASMRAHTSAPPPAATKLQPALPGAIDLVIATALAKRKEDRFASCSEMVASARRALGLDALSKSGMTRPSEVALLIREPPDGDGAVTGRLEVLSGEAIGARIETSREVVIGRGVECDLVLPDPKVSRRHACARTSEGVTWIEDLGSSNGTWVGNERIANATRLSDGDEIRVGDTALVYLERVADASTDTHPPAGTSFDPPPHLPGPPLAPPQPAHEPQDVFAPVASRVDRPDAGSGAALPGDAAEVASVASASPADALEPSVAVVRKVQAQRPSPSSRPTGFRPPAPLLIIAVGVLLVLGFGFFALTRDGEETGVAGDRQAEGQGGGVEGPATLEGSWSGATSQGEEISFVVADGRVERIELKVEFDAQACTSYSSEFALSIEESLIDGRFSIRIERADDSGGTTVSGALSPDGTATGEISASGRNPTCGRFSAEATWEASRG